MKKIAIIAPCILPVPAVKGGAVEELITCILNQNEISKKYAIDLYTVACDSYDETSYSNTRIIPIYINKLTSCIDKISDKLYRSLGDDICAKRSLDKKIVDTFNNYINEGNYSAVIVENQMSTAVELIKSLSSRDFPVYFHMHNDVDIYRSPEYIHFLVENGVQFIAISEYIKLQILKYNHNAVCHVLYNSINFDLYTMHEHSNSGTLKLLYAGRIIPEKGVLELANAFVKSVSSGSLSNCSLDIIGFDGGNRSYENSIRAIADRTNNIKCINRLSTEEMANQYDNYDVVVMPTLNEEPFGLVALETIAKGMPLITTNSGALPEVVGDGAMVVSKDDNLQVNLKNAIERIASDSEFRKELGEKAYRAARRNPEFSIDTYFERFINIVEPKNDRPMVSVIVPVYNVEKQICRCIDSLINQTYKNLEIILVDDGSTDSSGEICDTYKIKDSRIQVIHQKNMGISGARNKALSRFNGEYVFFVDSDDYIQLDTIEKLMNESVQYNADIVACGFSHVFDDKPEEEFTEGVPGLWSGKVSVIHMMRDRNICTVPWNKLYKGYLWKEISFPLNCLHEDEATIYKLLYEAKIVRFIPDCLYKYYQRPNSIMNDGLVGRHHYFTQAMENRIDYFLGKQEYLLAEHAKISLLEWFKYVYREIDDEEIKKELVKRYNNSINGLNAPRVMGWKKTISLLLWKYIKY